MDSAERELLAVAKHRSQTIAEKIEREIAIAMANRIVKGVSSTVREESYFYFSYDPVTDTFGKLFIWPVALDEFYRLP